MPNQATQVTWTCTASGTSVCNATHGTGNTIQLTADIPANQAITIDIIGEASGVGTIANTATVSSTVNDPSSGNNQSTAIITVTSSGIHPSPNTHPIPTHTPVTLIVFMLLLAGGIAVRLRRAGKLPMLCLILAFGLTLNTDNARAIFLNGDFETGNFSNWEKGYGLNYGLGGSHPFTADDVRITGGGKEILR